MVGCIGAVTVARMGLLVLSWVALASLEQMAKPAGVVNHVRG